jgi:hypothetical protein
MPTGQLSAPSHGRVRAPRAPRVAGEELRLRDGARVLLRALVHDLGAERAAITAADANGRIVGTAAFVRVYGPRAELTLEVDDAWWQPGLPEVLLADLCDLAALSGIATFLARVPPAEIRYRTLLIERFAARDERAGDRVDLAIATAAPPRLRSSRGPDRVIATDGAPRRDS